MARRPSFVHVDHLVRQLRLAASQNLFEAEICAEGGLDLCLGAALANDAADALEALSAVRLPVARRTLRAANAA